MRCFIGIPLPEQLREEINERINELYEEFQGGAKYVEKENLHVTMNYLGELTEKEVSEVKERLEKIHGVGDIKASIGEAGFFPKEEYVKVAWLGLNEGKEQVQDLHEKIVNTLQVNTHDYEEYIPHITLARVRYLKDRREFADKVKSIKLDYSWTIDHVTLYSSDLSPLGPTYTELLSAKL